MKEAMANALLGRRGQWRFRSSDPGLSPYTREVGIRVSAGVVETPNGISAGQFISPYAPDGFIWPELILFGKPQITHEFNLLPFLAQGSGPWLGGVPGVPQTETGPIVGQLSPWPGMLLILQLWLVLPNRDTGINQPPKMNCPVINPLVPVSNAGEDIKALPNSTVTLVGKVKNPDLPGTKILLSLVSRDIGR